MTKQTKVRRARANRRSQKKHLHAVAACKDHAYNIGCMNPCLYLCIGALIARPPVFLKKRQAPKLSRQLKRKNSVVRFRTELLQIGAESVCILCAEIFEWDRLSAKSLRKCIQYMEI